MDTLNLSPYVRLCRESILYGPLVIHERVIYDYELILLEKGQMTIRMDDQVHICTEGDVILLRPGHSHIVSMDTPIVSQPHVHFDPIYDRSREIVPISFSPLEAMSPEQRLQILPDDLLPMSIPTVFRPQTNWEIGPTLHRLAASQATKAPYCDLEGRAILTELLIHVCREFTPKSTNASHSSAAHLTTAIKAYIDNNYMNSITLDSLEQLYHIDKFYLTRLFKSAYGIPAIAYYHSVRFAHAKRMLENGYNVTETSTALGFDSIYSFSRSFYNAFGVRPSDWRKSNASSGSNNDVPESGFYLPD